MGSAGMVTAILGFNQKSPKKRVLSIDILGFRSLFREACVEKC